MINERHLQVPWTQDDVLAAIRRIEREVPTARIKIGYFGLSLAAVRGGSPKDGAAVIYDAVSGLQSDVGEAISWLKGRNVQLSPIMDNKGTRQ